MHKMAASSGGFKLNQFICDAPSGEIRSLIRWHEKGTKSSQVLSWQHYQRQKIKCWWEHTKPNELYYHHQQRQHPSNGVAYPKEKIVTINKINPAEPCLAFLTTLIFYNYFVQLSCLAGVKLSKLINMEHANKYNVDDDDDDDDDQVWQSAALFHHESSSKAIRYSKESMNDAVGTAAAA